MTDHQTGDRRTKNVVPLFDPKVTLFENISIKILAHLYI